MELEVRNAISGTLNKEAFDWVVLSDGFRSKLRDSLGVRMLGDSEMLHFLNVHFVSKKLSEAIQRNNFNAMLHFVYNSNVSLYLH